MLKLSKNTLLLFNTINYGVKVAIDKEKFRKFAK